MPSSSRSTPPDDPDATPEVEGESKAKDDKPKDAPFYCPGCGKRVQYQQTCTGRPDAPHPPIEVVPTDELSGDEEHFTKAPDSVV